MPARTVLPYLPAMKRSDLNAPRIWRPNQRGRYLAKPGMEAPRRQARECARQHLLRSGRSEANRWVALIESDETLWIVRLEADTYCIKRSGAELWGRFSAGPSAALALP